VLGYATAMLLYLLREFELPSPEARSAAMCELRAFLGGVAEEQALVEEAV